MENVFERRDSLEAPSLSRLGFDQNSKASMNAIRSEIIEDEVVKNKRYRVRRR